MLNNLVALFLVVALIFYCLLAGADYGAGILTLFSNKLERENQRQLIYHAIGPVWEANHVWLILVVVILFNGFPKAYSALSIVFHIPLTLTMIGVILRGCAFTFSNYDAVRDRSQFYYNMIFMISSFITPFMLGIIAGAIFLGRPVSVSSSFHEAFIAPWLNLFSLSVGLFACIIFAFLASTYMLGESTDELLRESFSRKARILVSAVFLMGGLIFLYSQLAGLSLAERFMKDQVSVFCFAAAIITAIPLWLSLKTHKILTSRLLAGSFVSLILLGCFKLQYPIILMDGGLLYHGPLTIYNSAAPELTLQYLLYALLAGSVLMFPSLGFLLKLFKS